MRKFIFLGLLFVASTAHAETAVSAVETMQHFYRHYLDFTSAHSLSTNTLAPPFSKGFAQLLAENKTLCTRYGKGEICGWGELDADPYMQAQDWDDHLTYDKAQVNVAEISPGKVRVTVNLCPFQCTPRNVKAVVLYKMIQESGTWMVDDIIHDDWDARKAILEENNTLLPSGEH